MFGDYTELLDVHQSHQLMQRDDDGLSGEDDDLSADEGDALLDGEGLLGDEGDEDAAERRAAARRERAEQRRQARLLAQVCDSLLGGLRSFVMLVDK